MTSILKAVDSWWAVHPHLVDLILCGVAIFASIFPERSRRWVLTPVYYPGYRIFLFMQRDAKKQLEIMRYIGDSAFNLLAYLCYYCIHAILWTLGMSIVIYIGVALLFYWGTRHVSVVPFYVLVVSGLIGRAIRLYVFLGFLMRHEKGIADLEKMAAGQSLDSLPGEATK